MLICLLKANIALSLFYVAYYFGLRRLTFYTLNRFFLLGGIVCAAICPFIDPSVFVSKHEVLNAVANTYAPNLALLNRQSATPLINTILAYIFWAGVITMSIRLLVQLLSLWKLHNATRAANITGNKVRITEKEVTPFSFMRHIYINPSLHGNTEMEAILHHEAVHVKQWHTLDVLLSELNKIFYWFNPGAWLMSVAIRENLEFITDRCILQQGVDAKTYQYSLIKVSGIPYATAIANNFNFSHLKNRIMMMNKRRSSDYHLLRYLVLGALVVISLLSMNFTRASIRPRNAGIGKLIQVLRHQQDTVPVPPPPPAPVPPKAPKAPKAPPAPPAPPVPPAPPAPPAPVPPPPPANTNGLGISDNGVVTGHPVYFLDDQFIGFNMPDIAAEDIESISVFKGESAASKYGDIGKNGVVSVFSKAYTNTGVAAAGNRVKVTREMPKPPTPPDVKVLWIVDGHKTNNSPVDLKPENIASISVIKDNTAKTIYGDEGKNGVIIVTTKKPLGAK